MGTLDISGLSVDDAVAIAGRKLDAEFAAHLVQQRALMFRHGMSRDDAGDALDHQKEFYLTDRAQHLDELRAALLADDNRLN